MVGNLPYPTWNSAAIQGKVAPIRDRGAQLGRVGRLLPRQDPPGLRPEREDTGAVDRGGSRREPQPRSSTSQPDQQPQPESSNEAQ